MMTLRKRCALILSIAILLASSNALMAQARTYSAQAKRYSQPTYFQRHPYQKTGLIGAGAGAAVGGLLFGEKHNRGKNMVKGAAAGALTGLGYEYLKKKGTFK